MKFLLSLKAALLAIVVALKSRLAAPFPGKEFHLDLEGLAALGSLDGVHYAGAELDGFDTLVYGYGPTRAAALRDLADKLDAAAPAPK